MTIDNTKPFWWNRMEIDAIVNKTEEIYVLCFVILVHIFTTMRQRWKWTQNHENPI